MANYTIDGMMLRDMFLTGAKVLENNRASVDALNVFPVPDGDTGTNMSMTMQSAARSLKDSPCNTVSEVAAAVSLGALKGARGNSGVILSQIFRGFSRALKDEDLMDAKLFSRAFTMGSEAAYKAVMRPKEGTILTVVRLISESLRRAEYENKTIPDMVDIMLESGERALKSTPDLLPVLKEAGVVDSGGMGLLAVLRGFKMALDGEEADETSLELPPEPSAEISDELGDGVVDLPDTSDIKFHYCTEFFIINLYDVPTEEDVNKLREKLIRIGDSVVVAYDEGFIKIHVHSCSPGKVLQLALRLGELDKVKIENMLEQNREMQKKLKESQKEYAIIAVCAGEGNAATFKELGATSVISGGQTMNPSIESISTAIRRANARNVFVLPNNSNIILAAQQAAAITTECNVIVIPTTTIVQGMSSIMTYNTDLSINENANRMNNAISKVVSGAVTYAVRSTTFEGNVIHEGDIIGMINNKIVITGTDVNQVSQSLVAKMIKMQPEDPVVTVLYGDGVTEDDANALSEMLEENHEDADVIVQFGGQPLYYYFFSVE